MTTTSLTLNAPAKINLHLEIGRRRKDGYHNLVTLFQEISLSDRLRFTPTRSSALSLRVSPVGLTSGPENLVIRALQLLREKLGVNVGMNVHLSKRIPVGAGLGGGSSDAAAALWAGWRLWKKGVNGSRRSPRPFLSKLAMRLGADVPFFLKGGRAWAGGIGEKLRSVRTGKRRWLLLIYPRVHVSTKEAYRLLDQSRARKLNTRSSKISRSEVSYFNSFEPVILSKFPKIAAAKKALIDSGCAPVMMSGSGSSVFGFVKSSAEGRRIRRILRRKPWDVFLAHT